MACPARKWGNQEGRRQPLLAFQSPWIESFWHMPEEGLEPPTRGLWFVSRVVWGVARWARLALLLEIRV